MAEVECRVCRRPFIASTIEAAMGRLRAHEAESHGIRQQDHWDREKREAGGYDELKLTAFDLDFLQGLKILL